MLHAEENRRNNPFLSHPARKPGEVFVAHISEPTIQDSPFRKFDTGYLGDKVTLDGVEVRPVFCRVEDFACHNSCMELPAVRAAIQYVVEYEL